MISTNYGEAIRLGFEYLLTNHKEVFTIGQGLWSPWYVGNSMTDLDKKFGKERVMDTPVSEDACTAVAIGASLCGYRPIIIHPRVDFMILATNSIVNQAAKWSHMLGGKAHPSVTIRGIINRGGQQGAQHSQALHSWFSHIPGLRVVMPSSVKDARDLLVAATLCDDPVLYIDDRWLYDQKADIPDQPETNLLNFKPKVIREGKDVTIVGSGFSVMLASQTAESLAKEGISAEVIDVMVLNPFDSSEIIKSVKKTGRLMVIDGSWKNCGFAGEVIASVVENIEPGVLKSKPSRITLPEAPAPSSGVLEEIYYPKSSHAHTRIKELILNG
jgi:pyruvate/2-oxoglutarate/acetoin dehydrogenase E1 component